MDTGTVLLINDHMDVAESWAHALRKCRFAVENATPNQYAKPIDDTIACDLIVVDVDIFDQRCLFLCRRLRKAFDGPMLVFTYEQDESFHLRLYQEGMDEIISKPISMPLALAKATAWLRRTKLCDVEGRELSTERFHLDLNQRVLTTPDGKKVRLSALEQRLIRVFLCNSGQVLNSTALADRVWSDLGGGDIVLLKNLVYRLRRKIETNPKDPRYVETVFGHGYRFHPG